MTYNSPASRLLVQAIPNSPAQRKIPKTQRPSNLPCYPPILTTCRTTCLSSTLTCPATLQRFLQQMQALSPSIVQSIRVFLQMGKWGSLSPQHKWKKREKVVSCCVGICTVSHSLKITLSNMEIQVCN